MSKRKEFFLFLKEVVLSSLGYVAAVIFLFSLPIIYFFWPLIFPPKQPVTSVPTCTASTQKSSIEVHKVYNAPKVTQPSGLTWHDGYLWLSSYMRTPGIYKINTSDGSVNSVFTPDIVWDHRYGGLASDQSSIFHITANNRRNAVELNVDNATIKREFSLHAPARNFSDITSHQNKIWAIGNNDARNMDDYNLYEFDYTGKLLRQFKFKPRTPTDYNHGMTSDGKCLWVSTETDLLKIDPENGNTVQSFELLPGKRAESLAWDGEYIWAASFYGDIYKISLQPSTSVIDNSINSRDTSTKPISSGWTYIERAGFMGNDYSYLSFDKNDIPYVAYKKGRGVGVMRLDGAGWERVGKTWFRIGNTNRHGEFTKVIFDSNNIPHIAYQDLNNEERVSVMKFNGSTWVPVGKAGFSGGSVFYRHNDMELDKQEVVDFSSKTISNAELISLAIDSNNTPYVAYINGSNTCKVNVMKFNGTSWKLAGKERRLPPRSFDASFSVSSSGNTSLAFDSNNIPYVAYTNNCASYGADVLRLYGSEWVPVGTGFKENTSVFSSREANYLTLAIDSDDTPYVAYNDTYEAIFTDGRPRVIKYNGSAWVQVGSEKMSDNTASRPNLATIVKFSTIVRPSLALDSNNAPYLAYADDSGPKVMKYNGAKWVPVVKKGFPQGASIIDSGYSVSLAIDSKDVPYVALGTGVMKFDQEQHDEVVVPSEGDKLHHD